jgi:hypothetical protein
MPINTEEMDFIVQSGLSVDVEKWAKMPSWTYVEAILIIYGIDPIQGMSAFKVLDKGGYIPTTSQKIKDAIDIAQRAILEEKLLGRQKPQLYFKWAKLNGLPLSIGLQKAVNEQFEKQKNADEEELKSLQQVIDERRSEELQPTFEPTPTPKFTHTPKTSTHGYFRHLEKILHEACAAGEDIPHGKKVYQLLLDMKPPHVRFDQDNLTLTYLKNDGEWNESVTIKAIGHAIRRRTKE